MSAIFLPKHISAIVTETFDCISILDAGETITGASVVCVVHAGVDPAPSSMLLGPPTVAGVTILQQITGGVVGVIYFLTCTITTSLGAIKIMQGYLAVIDSNPFEQT